MTTITTIHIIDQPWGGVTVCTTAGEPVPVGNDRHLTPGERLANTLLQACIHQASDVRYWHARDKAMGFALDLFDPEALGYADVDEIRKHALWVLGRPNGLGNPPAPGTPSTPTPPVAHSAT